MWWSIGLCLVTLSGSWLTGNKNKRGFLIKLYSQPLWIIYALAETQYGFIPMALVYAGVEYRNYRAWSNQEATSPLTAKG